jgi:hypothetical protein
MISNNRVTISKGLRGVKLHRAGMDRKLDAQIILPSGPLSISESAKRMFAIIAKYKELFVYGGRVVEMTKCSEDKMPVLSPLDGQAFRSRIEHYGPVMAWRLGGHGEWLLKPNARCSLDSASSLLATEERNLLPPIALIHNCPIFTEEGILGRGYHSVCGGRLIKAGTLPQQMTLKEAAKILLEIVSEFDFLQPADKSRAIAAILSPAFKPGELLKAHFPLFVFEADESEAGKGFFLQLVQAIYREYASFVTQRKGGVGSLMNRFHKNWSTVVLYPVRQRAWRDRFAVSRSDPDGSFWWNHSGTRPIQGRSPNPSGSLYFPADEQRICEHARSGEPVMHNSHSQKTRLRFQTVS